MTDAHLRELERRFRASPQPAAELAWLRARGRSEPLPWPAYERLHELDPNAAAELLRARLERGELSPERLTLAAKCGHLAAQGLATELSERSPASAVPPAKSTLELAWELMEHRDELLHLRIAEQLLPLCSGELRHIEPDLANWLRDPNEATAPSSASRSASSAEACSGRAAARSSW